VGINTDLVRHGETGFLAADAPAWRDALETLAVDPALRMRMGAAGWDRVGRSYSQHEYTKAYTWILAGLLGVKRYR
jgi:glycosyltransferase involved in cell wall biosynthesis